MIMALFMAAGSAPNALGQMEEAFLEIRSANGRSFKGRIVGMESADVVKVKHENGAVYSLQVASLSEATKRRVAEWKADAEARQITLEATDGRKLDGSIVGVRHDMLRLRKDAFVLTLPLAAFSQASREKIEAWKKAWEASATAIDFYSGGSRRDRIITVVKGAVVVQKMDGDLEAIPIVNLASETLKKIDEWGAEPSGQSTPAPAANSQGKGKGK